MKKLAIIGSPLGHTISPAIYNAAFPAMGVDAHYDAWPTPPEDVAAVLEKLRDAEMMGMNVTVPHKEAVLPLLDEVDPSARAIGAVNCIVKRDSRLIGYNTDKNGFIDSLRRAGFDPEGKNVLILGAGGSARAVSFGLAQARTGRVYVAGRSSQRVEKLVADLESTQAGHAKFEMASWQDPTFVHAARFAELVVNCTPIGMLGSDAKGETPISPLILRRGLWVCDLVYNPPETVLLRDARRVGAHVIGGLDMLVLQAVESIRLWTGETPPIDIMRGAALDAVGESQ